MLSINTIARVIVNVVRPAAQPNSWDTGLLLVKDSSFTTDKRLRIYNNSTEADRAAHKAVPIQCALTLAGSLESVVITVNVRV